MMTRREHREAIRYACQIGIMPTRRQIRQAYRRYIAMNGGQS